MFTIKASNVSLWQELVPLSYFYSDWIRRLQILHKLKIILLEGVNGVSRLATNGKKYYRLPTKREKKLPTIGTWTDTIYIFFFFRKKSILYFSYLSRKKPKIPCHKSFYSLTHYMREMLRLILSSSMESSTYYKPIVPQGHKDSSFLCQHFRVIYWNTKSKLNRL